MDSRAAVIGIILVDLVWRLRFAQTLVEQTLADTPMSVIQGARQVGESALAREVFADHEGQLLRLDSTAAYEAARADPHALQARSAQLDRISAARTASTQWP